MKVIFICSSLKPGRDGVGDYTRRLAAEMIRQGHLAAAIALNDTHESYKKHAVEVFGGLEIPILYLPSGWDINRRIEHAKSYIDEFNPEWISFQFVIFGYHPKGLPFGLDKKLASLGAGRHIHIMFHELWVQKRTALDWKYYLWGAVQQRIIKRLLQALNPSVIHTNTHLYQYMIGKLGFDAQYLALFSNIPNTSGNSRTLDSHSGSGKHISFVIFGHIHPRAPVKTFIEEIGAFAAKRNIKVSLSLLGRCGPGKEEWIRLWTAAGFEVNTIGEQTPQDISKALASASIGISTTPTILTAKSGAIAAMHEHGLSVICVAAKWKKINFPSPDIAGVNTYIKGNLEKIIDGELNLPSANTAAGAARQMIDAFLNYN